LVAWIVAGVCTGVAF